MEILPEHCLSCVHRLDVYMALLNTLEQFLILHRTRMIELTLLSSMASLWSCSRSAASSTKATTCWPVL